MQLTEMCCPHGRVAIYLVNDDLRVHVNPDMLDPVPARELQSIDQRVVLRDVVGGRPDGLRDLSHGLQAARSQERTNRRAAQPVPAVAAISVEKVVPAL